MASSIFNVMTREQQIVFDFLLRLGDTNLILAQRLVSWCGHGPVVEEDMALSNVALDLLGSARLWYAQACMLEGGVRTEDELAFNRDVPQWRNAQLVEQPNGSYADTLMRQFLFDHYHFALLEMLCLASDAALAAIAQKTRKEVAYHVRRSDDLIVRLGDGSPDSHQRMQDALTQIWPHCANLFSHQAGIALDQITGSEGAMERLQGQWLAVVGQLIEQATLELPAPYSVRARDRDGHTEHLGPLLAEMQFLQRTYPGARW